MRIAPLHNSSPRRRAGVTLLEVLTAIFITGVALLALLVLFPLGAMAMAQAIKDDRAGNIKDDAITFSQDGVDLLSRTGDFVSESMTNGKADSATAAELRKEYEALSERAAKLEAQLKELRAQQS
ncbi:MAG: prepilin-type N-terminal cleavage/methylation domain-containing protein, partial [Planctomycetia bacterium]|nr:prepilin-type N-terminal cleavage/methylation domain-containing protein [Planctomycetia bacterium]